MVRIKYLSGPHAHEVLVPAANAEPVNVLRGIMHAGWQWEMDYSKATSQEKMLWGKFDTGCRILRALRKNLPVRTGEKVFSVGSVGNEAEVFRVFGEIERYFTASGSNFNLTSDTEEGVVIEEMLPGQS